jgi:UDP-glucose 4-epimerase
MSERILITGSEGLVGKSLSHHLVENGNDVVHFDLRALVGQGQGDVRSRHDLEQSMGGCTGIVHLAAVSRVIWGERDPDTCQSTNVGGTKLVLDVAKNLPSKPWVLFASSREVYGEPKTLPVAEDGPLEPVNVYGRSKVAGESMVLEARHEGMRTAVVRLSNVYGSTNDHVDRVIPAFVRGALRGETLRVDGSEHTFDFTHIDDTIRGLTSLIAILVRKEKPLPPPIHLLTGKPTTLGELAILAIDLAGTRATMTEAPPRNYDVGRFYGDPRRARDLLGWEARVPLRDGVARLMSMTKQEMGIAMEEGSHA